MVIDEHPALIVDSDSLQYDISTLEQTFCII